MRSLIEDDWGCIYLGTDQGLDRLEPATGRVRHFTTADGLAKNQVLSSFRDRRGALWFGTHTGLSRLVPEPNRPTPAPAVLIHRLQIAGRAYPLSDLGAAAISDLTLARSQSNIQIEFGGLAFGAGEALRYQYRLAGADADWSAFTTRGAVNYANPDPGRYRFLARAINADGVVSATPASFSFTVLSPVWQRGWFLALAALTVGLAGYALYRYRVAQLLKLERMRTRIAADLHDDIGATPARLLAALQEAADGGAPMSPEVARRVVELFRDFRPISASFDLTPQERHLLKLLVEGHHKKTAAHAMGISFHTVSFHLKHIYEKLQVHSKSEAVAKALREHLV